MDGAFGLPGLVAAVTARAAGALLLEAVRAVDRTVTTRLEGNLSRLPAAVAGHVVHLPWAGAVAAATAAAIGAAATCALARRSTVRASARLVLQAAARVEILLTRGKCELGSAVPAG